jgi:3-dehydroquinate synthase
MITVTVQTRPRPYGVVVGHGVLDGAAERIRAVCGAARLVIVSDRNVAGHHLDGLSASLLEAGMTVSHVVLPPGEDQKTLARAEELYGVLYERKMTRADAVVALGGGVIGDLAGFVAATYLRGLLLVQVPTSLLAQVDAAVGGKVGVDFRDGKNHVGTFYQPRLVLADVATLSTLTAAERRNGAAEVAKYGLLSGGPLLARIEAALAPAAGAAVRPESAPSASAPGGSASAPAPDPVALCDEEIVAECVRYKAAVVVADEREESGERHLLNLGHTIGHAIEAAGGFSLYSHGESVGLGLHAALWLSRRLTGLDAAQAARGERLVEAAGAPSRLAGLDPHVVAGLVSRDKKAVADHVPFVLLEDLGRPVRGVHVSTADIEEVIAWLAAR